MIIDKNEEPFLHNFLQTAKAIFKESGTKNILLYGRNDELRFISGNYAGRFSYQTERLDADFYNFGNNAYEISSLPNDDIKLEPLESMPCSTFYLTNVEKLFSAIDMYSISRLEVFKADECKIAKILATTGCWLNDDSLKYLNKFKNMDIYMCDEVNRERFSDYTYQEYNPEYVAAYQELELDGGQTYLAATLVFNIRYNPRTSTAVQQKIDFKAIAEDESDIHFDDYEKVNEQEELDEMFNSLEDEELVDPEEEEEPENVYDPMLA